MALLKEHRTEYVFHILEYILSWAILGAQGRPGPLKSIIIGLYYIIHKNRPISTSYQLAPSTFLKSYFLHFFQPNLPPSNQSLLFSIIIYSGYSCNKMYRWCYCTSPLVDHTYYYRLSSYGHVRSPFMV